MGKRAFFTILSTVLALTAQPCNARVFFAGSNPQLTVFAFPQDIWLIPRDFVFYYGTWQTMPWWGDVDQPDIRPGPTYLLTGEKVGVKDSVGYFRHDAGFDNWKHTAGFTKMLSPASKLRFDFEYQNSPFSQVAEGVMTNAQHNRLRFDFSERHSVRDVYCTSYYSVKWGAVPLGFKLGYGREAATNPESKWTIIQNDTAYYSTRLAWAWSTLQGNQAIHFFPNYHNDVLGLFQDEYGVGSLTRLDLQAGATLARLKAGCRFRRNWGTIDMYNWQPDTAPAWFDPSLAGTFAGNYARTHKKQTTETTVRAYGNYTWIKREKFLFNTLALSRYTIDDSVWVYPPDAEARVDRTDRAGTFVLQINPNVNIYPWNNRFTYIDIAVLCNYSYTGFDHRRLWETLDGGQKKSWVSSDFNDNEDHPWTDFSYGRQDFFEIALDMNPTFPIYGNRDQAVAMSVSALIWTRFKWIDKYYGAFNDNSAEFDVSNIRKSFERETWFNSALNLIYKRGGWVYRVLFGPPLVYRLSPVTSIYEADGTTLVGRIKHKNMWVSQSGVQLGFFIASSFGSPAGISSQPRKTEE